MGPDVTAQLQSATETLTHRGQFGQFDQSHQVGAEWKNMAIFMTFSSSPTWRCAAPSYSEFFHDGLRSVCHLFKGKSILACRNTCQLPSRSPKRQNTLTGPISTPALETCSAFFAVGQPGLSTLPPGLKAKIYPVRGGSKL